MAFFVVLASHLTNTRWVRSTIKLSCTVHSLSSALSINLSNIKNSGTPRIKPGAAGREVQTLPMRYAPPPSLLKFALDNALAFCRNFVGKCDSVCCEVGTNLYSTKFLSLQKLTFLFSLIAATQKFPLPRQF